MYVGRFCTFRLFFFNDTATTEIYTLSLHDALPIWHAGGLGHQPDPTMTLTTTTLGGETGGLPLLESGVIAVVRAPDRKSTRLNSSHSQISYAVFCLKKKNYELH